MLGQGVYALAEVARLTQMHPNRVRSWFKQRSDGSGCGPIFESDYEPVAGDYAVSFFDLIDVLIAGVFRDKYNVPMRVVRRAHNVLAKGLDTKHPFCHSRLHTDGESIFRSTVGSLEDEILSDVISGQQFFLHIKKKLSHIDYSEMTEMARRWRIATGVVVDPTICMGKPTIVNTGVTTHVIARQLVANGRDTALVADLYGISETDVTNAVKFENWCRHRDAA